jgi:multiple sugar transport system permease protein
MVAIAEKIRTERFRFEFIFDRPQVLGSVFLAPAILYVLILVGIPFLLAVYYAFSAYTIYDPSYHFVGLRNFVEVVQSEIFRRTLANTFIFTIVRALIILPWAVPIALATVAWEWMFDSLYSVINWVLVALGLVSQASEPQWLGDPGLAMLCVIIVNAWRFFPFAIVIFLAGINAVPQDVLDAATVDGAGFWRRTYQIITPIIAPIVVVGLIFGTVFTFTDLSVVYLLTMGGPVDATQVLGNLGFQIGILSGDVAHGAAVSLFMFPVLLILVILMLRFIRRREI